MPAQLIPLKAGSAPSIPVRRPLLLIGRHPECDVRLDQSTISRRHCCVALAYDRVIVRDLGSRNGLRVNGRLVDEAQLHPGDEIAIGPLLFRMEVIPEAASPPPASPSRPSRAAGPADFPDLQADTDDSDSDLYPLVDR